MPRAETHLRVTLQGPAPTTHVGRVIFCGTMCPVKNSAKKTPVQKGSKAPNSRADKQSANSPWLVVGLGNPGAKYESTRHNVGFMVIDEFASRQFPTPTFSAHKRSNANIAEITLPPSASAPSPRKIILAKPRTYMNVSGGPVKALADFFKVSPDHIIVVHDELELDPGEVRLRLGGGDKGHNGLKDITKSLGTKDYQRLDCGIGRPPGRMDPAAYVLKPFPKSMEADVAIMCADAADAIERLIN